VNSKDLLTLYSAAKEGLTDQVHLSLDFVSHRPATVLSNRSLLYWVSRFDLVVAIDGTILAVKQSDQQSLGQLDQTAQLDQRQSNSHVHCVGHSLVEWVHIDDQTSLKEAIALVAVHPTWTINQDLRLIDGRSERVFQATLQTTIGGVLVSAVEKTREVEVGDRIPFSTAACLRDTVEQPAQERNTALTQIKEQLQLNIEAVKQAEVQRQRIETALRTSETKFRHIYYHAPVMMCSINQQGVICDVNRKWLEEMGYPRDEVIGQPIDRFMASATAARTLTPVIPPFWQHSTIQDNVQTQVQDVVYQLIRKDNSVIDVMFSCNVTIDPWGQPVNLAVLQTVTEYQQTQIALHQSEARYRAIVEDQTELICRFRPDGTLTFVNEAYCRYFGRSQESLIGQSFMPLIPEADQALVAKQMKQLSFEQPTVTYEHRVILPDGETRWQQWTDRAIFNSRLEFVEFQAVGRDITALKKTEAALKLINEALEIKVQERTAAFNRAIAHLQQEIGERQRIEASLEIQVQDRTAELQQALAFEAVLKRVTDKVRDSLDETLILQTAVQELAQILQVSYCNATHYTADLLQVGIIYEDANAIYQFHEPILPVDHFSAVYQQLQQGACFQFCVKIRPPARGWSNVLICPVTDNQGILGDLLLFDQRERVFTPLEIRLVKQVANQCAIAIRQARLYQAVQTQVKELERLNHLKDDFLSTVSHELRSPVANMKMALQMLGVTIQACGESDGNRLSDRDIRAKLELYWQILNYECKRETDLINDLLDIQRLEAGNQKISLSEIPLSLWLPRIVKPFQERAQNREQILQLEFAADLPEILFDALSLERILAELLTNACKYTPPGEQIVVAVQAQSEFLELKVTNFGSEIPLHQLPLIFDRFYRIPNADLWRQGGTGLGLALIKKLTEHLNGSIEVTSQENQTCFMVRLPLNLSTVKQSGQEPRSWDSFPMM
jgi:PAS domain S-box-containing protein